MVLLNSQEISDIKAKKKNQIFTLETSCRGKNPIIRIKHHFHTFKRQNMLLFSTWNHWPQSQHLLHMDAHWPAVTPKITPLVLIWPFQAVSSERVGGAELKTSKAAHVCREGSTPVSPFTLRSCQS